MKRIKIGTGTGGQSTSAIQQSDAVILADLVANTNKTIAIPGSATTAIFQFYGATELFARLGGAAFAGIPAASDTLQELMVNPDVRTIEAGQTEIHAVSASDGLLVINFYGG